MSKSNTTTPSSSRTPSPRYWARYVGTPEHRAIPGVPARDLTVDEVEHWGIDLLTNGRCYEFVEVSPDDDQDNDHGDKET